MMIMMMMMVMEAIIPDVEEEVMSHVIFTAATIERNKWIGRNW